MPHLAPAMRLIENHGGNADDCNADWATLLWRSGLDQATQCGLGGMVDSCRAKEARLLPREHYTQPRFLELRPAPGTETRNRGINSHSTPQFRSERLATTNGAFYPGHPRRPPAGMGIVRNDSKYGQDVRGKQEFKVDETNGYHLDKSGSEVLFNVKKSLSSPNAFYHSGINGSFESENCQIPKNPSSFNEKLVPGLAHEGATSSTSSSSGHREREPMGGECNELIKQLVGELRESRESREIEVAAMRKDIAVMRTNLGMLSRTVVDLATEDNYDQATAAMGVLPDQLRRVEVQQQSSKHTSHTVESKSFPGHQWTTSPPREKSHASREKCQRQNPSATAPVVPILTSMPVPAQPQQHVFTDEDQLARAPIVPKLASLPQQQALTDEKNQPASAPIVPMLAQLQMSTMPPEQQHQLMSMFTQPGVPDARRIIAGSATAANTDTPPPSHRSTFSTRCRDSAAALRRMAWSRDRRGSSASRRGPVVPMPAQAPAVVTGRDDLMGTQLPAGQFEEQPLTLGPVRPTPLLLAQHDSLNSGAAMFVPPSACSVGSTTDGQYSGRGAYWAQSDCSGPLAPPPASQRTPRDLHERDMECQATSEPTMVTDRGGQEQEPALATERDCEGTDWSIAEAGSDRGSSRSSTEDHESISIATAMGTQLLEAAKAGNSDEVIRLLNSNACPDATDREGISVLQVATNFAPAGSVSIIRQALLQAGARETERDRMDWMDRLEGLVAAAYS